MAIFSGYSAGVKVGMIVPFSGTQVPDGFLICDGSAISRTLYSDLFAAIGTTYGSGDGSTTFNLPNFVNRTFWGGSSSPSMLNGNVPNITGSCVGYIYWDGNDYGNVSGAFSKQGTQALQSGSGSSVGYRQVNFNASNSSNRYTSNNIVRPECIQTYFCIKY